MNSEKTKIIAGVLIAAGESKRLGVPKQLIKWKGKTLIEFIIDIVQKANIQPIYVVLGANYENIKKKLKKLKIEIIHNESWQEGKGSSIRKGIRSLPSWADAAIIFVVDQPYLTVNLVKEIIRQYQVYHYQIIAPIVNGIQTNPVLLDRSVFEDLKILEGEAGARTIFSKYNYYQINWQEKNILYDIDHQSDMKYLKT